jgi:hypothetical protein
MNLLNGLNGLSAHSCGRRQARLSRFFPFLCLLVIFLAAAIPVLGQGSNFSAGVNYAVPGAYVVAVGDFNGEPDIVVTNNGTTVSILIGNGDGTFQAPYTIAAVPATGPYSTYETASVAVGDFNGDGKLDLAVLCDSPAEDPTTAQGSVNILLGDGTGHFGAPTVIPLDGLEPLQILSADFNNDTHLDLAVLNAASSSITILLGNGNGTFNVLTDTPVGSQPFAGNAAMVVADLNKDGHPDLAVAGTSDNDGVVSVLLGKGDGTFFPAANWITSSTSCVTSCAPPTTVAAGDFNGDGTLDLAVDDGVAGGMFVLLGNGDGTLQTPPIHSGNAASGLVGENFLVTGDFNGDGKLDLAEGTTGVYPGSPDLNIYLGNGDGTFAPLVALTVGAGAGTSFPSATSTVTDDLNGDGFPDLILATNPGYSFSGYYAVTVVLNCGLRCTNTAISSSIATSVFNQSVTFTAAVTPANPKATGTPTGSVIFQDTSTTPVTTLGNATLSAGHAVFAYSGLSVGTHTITAAYQGDSNFDPSASLTSSTAPSLTQVVTMAPTTTAIGSTPDPSNPGQSVTFTATVVPSTSGVPTGTVVFTDNGTQVVSQPLNSGSATFMTSSLSTGTHSIGWTYSGDSNFGSSISPLLTQIVGTNAAPFVLSSSATSATVSAGGSAAFTITVASVPSLNTAIVFSCSGLPKGANCTFNPAQITPSSATTTTTLTVTTTGPNAALQGFPELPSRPNPAMPIAALGLAALALFPAGRRQARRKLQWLPALFCTVFILSAALACGGGSNSSPNPNQTPPGTSTLAVIGSSNNVSQSITVTLTVN